MPLLERAYALWSELEQRSGRKVFAKTGILLTGPDGGSVIQGARTSAEMHGINVENLSSSQAMKRWPIFNIPEDWAVLYEPQGGAFFVEDCIKAHINEAKNYGLETQIGAPVKRYYFQRSDIILETNSGNFSAKNLILCPGPWSSELLNLRNIELTVLSKSLFWYQLRNNLRVN